jgi:hypothetical protein
MVLRSDKIEIESSEPKVNESEEAVEMEVSHPFVRNFSQPSVCRSAELFRKCEQTLPQARPSAKGEFQ